MKKIVYYVVFIAGGLLNACTGDLIDLNNDPKSYIEAKPGALFLSGQKNLADAYGSVGAGVAPFRVLSQVWTENAYPDEAQYNLARNNAPSGWWSAIYTKALVNLEHAKRQYAKDEQDANVLKNDLAIIDVLEVYAYYLLVNTYGDVPYSEALQTNIPFPKYDDAKTIVLDLLARLDTDIANLNAGYGSVGNADQIYNGNVSKWKKFAATLKLKAALLLADTDAQLAGAKVQEAVASGVFASNDDNALFKYDGTAPVNSNPVGQVVSATTTNFSPAAFFINTLNQRNDPRLPLFFTQVSGNYAGGVAGEINNPTNLSKLTAFWLSNTLPVALLDYSETEFLLAEALERGIAAGGTAEAHYKAAIKASILYWGGTEAAANAYLDTEPSAQYASTSWKEKIGYQKWFAFADRNWDAWTEIRRLGHPNIDAVSPPANATGILPKRFNYPPVEQTSNPDNWAEAVAKISGKQDVTSAKLFWQQ
jgi:hypothetical protein